MFLLDFSLLSPWSHVSSWRFQPVTMLELYRLVLTLRHSIRSIIFKWNWSFNLFPFFPLQIIQAREEEQKLSLAKVCKLFNSWPLLSLKKIAGLIKWRKFPPGQGNICYQENSLGKSMFCSKILYDFSLVHRAEYVCSIEVLVMLSKIKSLLTNTTSQATPIPHEVSFEM